MKQFNDNETAALARLTGHKALSENNCPDWRRMFAQLQGGAQGA